MFRNISNERQTPPADHRVASPAVGSQESSWIGLLSRPALVLLQRYLPARRGDAALPGGDAHWWGVGLKPSSSGEDGDFLRQFGAIMPLTQTSAPPLSHRSCGLTGAAADSAHKWLHMESLQELGIENVEEMHLNMAQQTQMGYLSFVRTLLSVNVWRPVLTQEMKPTAAGKDRLAEALCPPGSSRTWVDSFFGVDHTAQKGLLSHLSCAERRATTARLCPQQAAAQPGAETIDAFVPSVSGELMLAEITGAPLHKEEAADNGGLLTVQNTDECLSVRKYLSSSGAATVVGGEVTLLTPEQDNGYFSLEEEQMGHLHLVKALSQSTDGSSAVVIAEEEEEQTVVGGGSSSAAVDEEEDQCVAVSSPHCHNKAIAFIMGCPCSDDSQSDEESSDDDDDAGFDSEGSSELSDSADEDEDDEDDASDSDGEFDSDTERLWSSLCQSQDPYNPRNFTARLHTGRTPPQAIAAAPPSSAQSSPASSPDVTPLPSSHDLDIWDDSSSASEVDEAESLRLLNSFSSSDPYCLFSFQVPLRTRGPRAAAGTPTPTPLRHVASAPEYRKEAAEERLDSGFSESLTAARSCRPAKKVRFRDDVEVFSMEEEEEDRRGPWEELARDRCRFLRRCQEVELSIAYCLQPQHRSLVFSRRTDGHGRSPTA